MLTISSETEELARRLAAKIGKTPEDAIQDALHARATAKFVQCVEKYEADITVTRCGETVGGTSIMGILTLGAGMGTDITVNASGPQAEAALAAIAALVANRFGEDD